MSTPASVGGRGDQVGGFQEIEGRMREQIRVLQEQRAAAMMTEIVDLQRERDMAVGKLKRMERSVAGDGIGRGGGGGQGAVTLLTVLVSKHTFSLSSSIYLSLSPLSLVELQRENDALRATAGGGKAADRIVFLERALMEERLLTSDLRTKLKTKSGRGRLSLVASEVCVLLVFINFTGSADIVTLKRMLINVKENVFKLLKKTLSISI